MYGLSIHPASSTWNSESVSSAIPSRIVSVDPVVVGTLEIGRVTAVTRSKVCEAHQRYRDFWNANVERPKGPRQRWRGGDEHQPSTAKKPSRRLGGHPTCQLMRWVNLKPADGKSTQAMIIWLVVLTILKNISQWEGLSHILWKIKNPNHQPAIYTCIHRIYSWYSYDIPQCWTNLCVAL